jgi:alkylated DNA nucleotide flippase Atl1
VTGQPPSARERGQDRPRGSADGPRRGQAGPRRGQGGVRRGENGSRGSESGPRHAESGPRGGESAPRSGPVHEPRGPVLDDYASRVLDVVDSIAPGTVLSYGDVADVVGEGGPRQVGRIMAVWGGGVPWWRVVHADGSLLAGHEQTALARYAAENTPLRRSGGGLPRIDMRRARAQP